MDIAREIVPEVAVGTPALVLATMQTRGRGRQGRDWKSAPEGFTATFAFCTSKPVSEISGFSLVVGLALKNVLDSLGCKVNLKWPNDVMSLDGRKLCGILIEVITQGDRSYVLTGVGMNLNKTPAELPTSISLLEITRARYSALDIAKLLAPELYGFWVEFEQKGFPPLRESWESCAWKLGERLQIDTGRDLLDGTFVGVDDRGCLLLDTGQGLREVSAGHVLEF